MADPPGGGGGGGDGGGAGSTYFTEGRTDPPREAIESKGFNCFSREVHTNISKEAYSNF